MRKGEQPVANDDTQPDLPHLSNTRRRASTRARAHTKDKTLRLFLSVCLSPSLLPISRALTQTHTTDLRQDATAISVAALSLPQLLPSPPLCLPASHTCIQARTHAHVQVHSIPVAEKGFRLRGCAEQYKLEIEIEVVMKAQGRDVEQPVMILHIGKADQGLETDGEYE